MALTLKEIAADLKLSISTISRVLNNKAVVNEETRQRVVDYLRQRDSLSMLHTGNGHSFHDVVAVVIPDISEDYFDFVVRSIENCLWKKQIGMLLCDTMENESKEMQYMNMLIEKNFKGIILATIDKNVQRLSSYHQKGLNIVYFDNLPNIDLPYNAVITDNIKSSILAVNHLASHGHRQIGFISGRKDETTGFERLVGYRRAMEINGLQAKDEWIVFGDYKEQSGYRGMLNLLARNKEMTAVFVSSSKMTYGAMKALADQGIRVPEDMAVIGFDVHDSSGLIRPGITTIVQNEEQIGRLCVDTLLREGENTDSCQADYQRILLEPRLIIRETCGCTHAFSGDSEFA
ncbi:MAG: LacI family transcriptional regulator [Ruminococcaceae bacterium]|jgi:LacI family transcriptional regulator|nr:LacI family transcriptional regulator [Oscillospiraceae bacterium]